MTEKNPKTFRETPLSDDDRQSIVSVLKEEGFSEEQLNAMSSEKVWKLYIDSLSAIMSSEISEMARAFERNPQLASTFNPLIKRMNRQLEDLVDSLEKELDKKKEKSRGQAMSEVKKCPKCSSEMDIGHLRDAPYWRKGTSLWQIGFGPRVYAYRCKSCGYVELYTEKERGVKP